jgi:Yip1 domain
MTDGPTIPPPMGGSSSPITRAINILTKPATEWPVIEREASSNGKLITYAAILALLAPIFSLLYVLLSPVGSLIFNLPGLLIKMLLLSYLMALLPPVLLGFILDALTPNLGGVKNSQNAMKLAVYSGTAYWVGAIGLILSPWLWLVLGLGYAGYLLWIGTPILMKTPTDKTPVFVGAAVGIWVVLYIILNVISQNIIWSSFTYGAMM